MAEHDGIEVGRLAILDAFSRIANRLVRYGRDLVDLAVSPVEQTGIDCLAVDLFTAEGSHSEVLGSMVVVDPIKQHIIRVA